MLYEKVYAFIDNSWVLLNDIKDLKIDGGTLEHFFTFNSSFKNWAYSYWKYSRTSIYSFRI